MRAFSATGFAIDPVKLCSLTNETDTAKDLTAWSWELKERFQLFLLFHNNITVFLPV